MVLKGNKRPEFLSALVNLKNTLLPEAGNDPKIVVYSSLILNVSLSVVVNFISLNLEPGLLIVGTKFTVMKKIRNSKALWSSRSTLINKLGPAN